MTRRSGTLPQRKTLALFLAVAAISVCALAWMAARLLAQDRALEAQRLQEQRETPSYGTRRAGRAGNSCGCPEWAGKPSDCG